MEEKTVGLKSPWVRFPVACYRVSSKSLSLRERLKTEGFQTVLAPFESCSLFQRDTFYATLDRKNYNLN